MFPVHVVFAIYFPPFRTQQAPALIPSPANFKMELQYYSIVFPILCDILILGWAFWTKPEDSDVVKEKLGNNVVEC